MSKEEFTSVPRQPVIRTNLAIMATYAGKTVAIMTTKEPMAMFVDGKRVYKRAPALPCRLSSESPFDVEMIKRVVEAFMPGATFTVQPAPFKPANQHAGKDVNYYYLVNVACNVDGLLPAITPIKTVPDAAWLSWSDIEALCKDGAALRSIMVLHRTPEWMKSSPHVPELLKMWRR